MARTLGSHARDTIRSLATERDPTCHKKKKKKAPHAATRTWWYSQINKLKYLPKKRLMDRQVG